MCIHTYRQIDTLSILPTGYVYDKWNYKRVFFPTNIYILRCFTICFTTFVIRNKCYRNDYKLPYYLHCSEKQHCYNTMSAS